MYDRVVSDETIVELFAICQVSTKVTLAVGAGAIHSPIVGIDGAGVDSVGIVSNSCLGDGAIALPQEVSSSK